MRVHIACLVCPVCFIVGANTFFGHVRNDDCRAYVASLKNAVKEHSTVNKGLSKSDRCVPLSSQHKRTGRRIYARTHARAHARRAYTPYLSLDGTFRKCSCLTMAVLLVLSWVATLVGTTPPLAINWRSRRTIGSSTRPKRSAMPSPQVGHPRKATPSTPRIGTRPRAPCFPLNTKRGEGVAVS